MSAKKTILTALVSACLLFALPAWAEETTDTPNDTQTNTAANSETNNIPSDSENQQTEGADTVTPQPSENKPNVIQIHDKVILYPANTTATVNADKILMAAAPYVDQDVTMVPLRFLTQDILKATVNWDQASKTVTIISPDKTVTIDLTNNTVLDGEVLYQAPLPPVEKDGYTFVPLRLLAEVFGCTVSYDAVTKQITIVTPSREVILPIADFKQESTVTAGQMLTLYDYSYDPVGNAIIDREWKVEKDGELVTSTHDLSKTFSYPPAGIYDISLRVKNAKNVWSNWTTQTIEILVNEPPVITKFNATTTRLYPGEDIDFSYTASNEHWEEITQTRYTYTWKDEKGETQEVTEKPRSFWYPGFVTVALQVKDAYGNWSEPQTLDIQVYKREVFSELAYKFQSVVPGEIYLNHNNINYNNYPAAEITDISHQPVTLLASNNPEKVSMTGILYQDSASGNIRLRFHHRNTATYKINIWAIARNTSDHPITLTIGKKAQVGPWPDVLQVGQQVVVNYLQGEINSKTVTIQPGEQYIINQGQRALAIDDLVAGLIDVSCPEPLEFTICSVPDTMKNPDVTQLVKLDKILTHIRGTFANATINMSVTASGKEIEKIIIGREDAYEGYYLQGNDAMTNTPTFNNGNRGVLHHITITAEKKVGVMLNPRGTMFQGSLINFDGSLCYLANSGLLKGSHNGVIIGTLEAGETKTLTYMAPSGSDSPILIMLIPEEDWES